MPFADVASGLPGRVVVGSLAAVLAAAVVYRGRRDLTHPAVPFLGVFFTAVALSQLRLTDFEHAWSNEFTALVVGGACLLAGGVVFAGGTDPVRGTIAIDRSWYRPKFLLILAAALFVGALAGLAWKASILGGVPLFSEDPDAVRGRGRSAAGEFTVPAPATFLTHGFAIAGWLLLVVAWVVRPERRLHRAALGVALVICAVGAFSGASRHALAFALAIPLIGAYILAPQKVTTGRLLAVTAAVIVLLSSFFLIRSSGFVGQEIDEQPVVAKPVIPVYVSAAYPLETERRLLDALPDRFSYGLGANSLNRLPDFVFPEGKPLYRELNGSLTVAEDAPFFTVATYQGLLAADFGASGVLLGSFILGLLFGLAYRACRGASRFLAIFVLGFVAYEAALFTYTNAINLTFPYVFVVLALAEWLARDRRAAPSATPAGMPVRGAHPA
jgi:oligosaccharide repeat unit polymerase